MATDRIRAALFDFGGVIVDTPLTVFTDYERRHRLEPGVLNRTVVETGEDGAWARLERGELVLGEFAEAFTAEVRSRGAEVDVHELLDGIGELRPRPAMLEAVRYARARVPTALGTNNWHHPGMDGVIARLRDEFDVVVESCEVGVRKPDPRFYEIACDRLGVTAEGVVFLDDLGRNLKPARAMGMHTIKVTDPAAAIAELRRVLPRGPERAANHPPPRD